MWLAKIESGTWFLNRVAIFSHKYKSIKGIFPGTSPLNMPCSMPMQYVTKAATKMQRQYICKYTEDHKT